MNEKAEKNPGRNRIVFSQAVTIGTAMQLAAILIMLAAGWCNLQKELALIRHDLDQLIYLNRQRQMSEVRRQRLEVRDQELEVRCQKSEVRGQKIKVIGYQFEGRSLSTEI